MSDQSVSNKNIVRPIAGKAELSRVYVTGQRCDLGYVNVEFRGLTIGVSLGPDGEATLPRGVKLSPEDHAAVEAAAHQGFVREVVERLALQRERRLSATVPT